MRIPPPPEPSLLTAFFCAPLITPIVAIPLVALLPGVYTSEFDMVIALPFVLVLSLIYGYLGMVLVCLPVFLLLLLLKRLNSVRLCLFTTAIGAGVWTCLFGDLSGPAHNDAYLASFVVGAGCSLGVSAFFCALGGITIRSNRHRFAAPH